MKLFKNYNNNTNDILPFWIMKIIQTNREKYISSFRQTIHLAVVAPIVWNLSKSHTYTNTYKYIQIRSNYDMSQIIASKQILI